jgi:hypothetical protein
MDDSMTVATITSPTSLWVHHHGYSHHVSITSPGILQLLRDADLARGARCSTSAAEAGCFARELLRAGYAGPRRRCLPAMVSLAREHAPAATRSRPACRAVFPRRMQVSTGHVPTSIRPTRSPAPPSSRARSAGGMLAIDLMTERLCRRDIREAYARVEDDWAIVTRFLAPPHHVARPNHHRLQARGETSGGAATNIIAT